MELNTKEEKYLVLNDIKEEKLTRMWELEQKMKALFTLPNC